MKKDLSIFLVGLKEPSLTQCENVLRKNHLPYKHLSNRDFQAKPNLNDSLLLIEEDFLFNLDSRLIEDMENQNPYLFIFCSKVHLELKKLASQYRGVLEIFFQTSFEWWIEQKIMYWWRHALHKEQNSGELSSSFVEPVLLEGQYIKGDFASMMSHEIRTPLSAMKGALASLQGGYLGNLNHSQKEFLEIASRNADRLKIMVTEFLDLIKFKAGKMRMNLASTSLRMPLFEAYQAFRIEAEKKEITLEFLVKSELPSITIDANKIYQVALNLLSNALKYTPNGGSIWINAHHLEDCIRVEIGDSGIGISQENLSLVFEEFSQIDSFITRQKSGTGLGLAICKEIIHAHQGSIHVESKLGEGSIFTFTLPLRLEKTV